MTPDVAPPPSDVVPDSPIGYAKPVRELDFLRLDDGARAPARSAVATEVPVAVVYNGRPHVVMMCTPQDLEDFATGFTVTEGIAAARDVRRLDVVRYSRGIEVQVEIPGQDAERLASRARTLTGRTGCGLCGVEVIEEALRETPPVRAATTFHPGSLWKAGDALRLHQPLNNATNAIHAAAWCTADGEPRVVREDVGRHNAVDKVIGALARAGDIVAGNGFLLVTSRASYELVQKSAVAGIPLLAAVSRPTALAVQLAQDAGITLVGLLRGRTANVYTHPARIV
jgi:FdhD protein/phenylacetyl-CoA:acceptor oxidoreductase accessory protein